MMRTLWKVSKEFADSIFDLHLSFSIASIAVVSIHIWLVSFTTMPVFVLIFVSCLHTLLYFASPILPNTILA